MASVPVKGLIDNGCGAGHNNYRNSIGNKHSFSLSDSLCSHDYQIRRSGMDAHPMFYLMHTSAHA